MRKGQVPVSAIDLKAILLIVAGLITAGCSNAPPVTGPVEVPLLCYEVSRADTLRVFAERDVRTQFGPEEDMRIRRLHMLCEPVHKAFSEDALPDSAPGILPLTAYDLLDGSAVGELVRLKDQFMEGEFTVGVSDNLWDPVKSKRVGFEPRPGSKYPTPLKRYAIAGDSLDEPAEIFTRDQFGKQSLKLHKAMYLLEPAVKSLDDSPPAEQKPLTCYETKGTLPDISTVTVTDQFGEAELRIREPVLFCDPCLKVIL